MPSCWCKRHNTNNCKAFPFSSTRHANPTQNINNTETSSPPKEKQHTKLDEYVNSLKTLGKTDNEIFSTLKMCYEEPEELAEISTYPNGVHKAWDFKKGSYLDVFFSIIEPCTHSVPRE